MQAPLEVSQGLVRDHVRTPGGFHQDLFKSFSQGAVQDQAKAPDSMSLGFSPGRVKDLDMTLTKVFMPGPLREAHKTVKEGPASSRADLTRS